MFNHSMIMICVLFICASCTHNPPLENIFTISQEELNKLQLEYYSDYFSFVGEDNQGKVSFAIDNNRGQDQRSWQADHFLVMHDEHKGWQSLIGNGLYPNTNGLLKQIPDSEYFQFRGTPQTGMKLLSQANKLELQIEPLQNRLSKNEGLSIYQMNSGTAVLSWNDRTIPGRVIHEFLYLPAFNRLSRKYLGVFKDFHGIYAKIGNYGDLYIHSQDNPVMAKLIGLNNGFIVMNNETLPLNNLIINPQDRSFRIGLHRWPDDWQGSFDYVGKQQPFSLQLKQRNDIANWFIGGFAMGIVNGTVQINDEKIEVYGLGEVIL